MTPHHPMKLSPSFGADKRAEFQDSNPKVYFLDSCLLLDYLVPSLHQWPAKMFLQVCSKPLGGRRRQDFSSNTVSGFGASGISNGRCFSSMFRGYRSCSEGKLSIGSGSLYHLYEGCRSSQHMSGGLCKEFHGSGEEPYSFGGEFGGCFGGGHRDRFYRKYFSSLGVQPIQLHATFLQLVHVDLDPHLKQVIHQEKEQIKHLNNQFVSFIDKVRCQNRKSCRLCIYFSSVFDTTCLRRYVSIGLKSNSGMYYLWTSFLFNHAERAFSWRSQIHETKMQQM